MFSVRWAAPLFSLIRVAHCALCRASGIFFCQDSDDYQRLRPEAGARFVLEFSVPIAWPAVADGVAKGTTRNMVIRDRFTSDRCDLVADGVAVIVWKPGIGFFAYGTISGYRYAFCMGVGGINLGVLRGRAGLRIGTGRRWASGRLAASLEGGKARCGGAGQMARAPGKERRPSGSVSFQVV